MLGRGEGPETRGEEGPADVDEEGPLWIEDGVKGR